VTKEEKEALTAMMVSAAEKRGINQSQQKRYFLGPYESGQMLKEDALRSARLDVDESHHLCWILAYICGVRPSSLAPGKPANRNQYFPKWSDVKITRGTITGSFNVDIQFRFLKHENDPKKAVEVVVLPFQINSPVNIDNLPFSPAHRLLSIALRRGLLEKHTTFESLLRGTEFFIRVKPARADEPLFLAGRNRGLVSESTPVKTNGITIKFQKAVKLSGYGLGVTLYAWRQRFATAVNRAVGADRARYAMNHAPGTKRMEKHYEKGNFNLLVMEIAMGERIDNAQATMEVEASAALTRMSSDSVARIKAIAEEICKERMQTDEVYLEAIKNGDPKAKKHAIQKLRKYCFDETYEKQLEKAEDELQGGDVYARKAEKKYTGRFMGKIREYFSEEALPANNDNNPSTEIYDHRDAEERQADADVMPSSRWIRRVAKQAMWPSIWLRSTAHTFPLVE